MYPKTTGSHSESETGPGYVQQMHMEAGEEWFNNV